MKSQFNCRLSEVCIAEIKRVADDRGLSQGEVVEMWAEFSSGEKGVGSKKESEEKPGEIRGFFQEEKKVVVIPKGVITGDKVKEPVKKKVGGALMEIADGRITNQVNDLRMARVNAQPWGRDRQMGK